MFQFVRVLLQLEKNNAMVRTQINIQEEVLSMKKGKKVIGVLMCSLLLTTSSIPVMAASQTFQLGSTSGTISLNKGTEGYTAKTAFGVGKQITATRKVTLTVNYSKSGVTSSRSDTKTAVTNSGNYSSTTASVTVNRPSSSYTLKSASSVHSVTSGSQSYNNSLSL